MLKLFMRFTKLPARHRCLGTANLRGVTLLGGGIFAAAALIFCGADCVAEAAAQSGSSRPASSSLAELAVPLGLPDAPEANPLRPAATTSLAEAKSFDQNHPSIPKVASRYDKYILPEQTALPITARDKFILGARDAFSPLAITGWVASAAYEQVLNGSPNYGQNGKGFAQRLGAGAVRDVTEGMFCDSILAPILHEDPRYYKLGHGHSFVHRLVYSGSRGLITRTDSGRTTINFANIGGNLGGAMLTNTYYPELNQGFSETAKTFGSSVGGSALGFVVSEFLSDTFVFLHLKHGD